MKHIMLIQDTHMIFVMLRYHFVKIIKLLYM